jgi:16S rRNA (adenine1518-N6/adenine1519-N6)-dimethyltransferase
MRKSGPRSIGDNQLDGLPPLREVTAAHGLLAKKSLGQNFLFDLNLTRRIARAAAPLTTATIVEIGPGPGGLTRALLTEGAQKVIVVERDARCLAALAEIANHYPGRLEIVEVGQACWRGEARARLRQPALSHRDRAACPLA